MIEMVSGGEGSHLTPECTKVKLVRLGIVFDAGLGGRELLVLEQGLCGLKLSSFFVIPALPVLWSIIYDRVGLGGRSAVILVARHGLDICTSKSLSFLD